MGNSLPRCKGRKDRADPSYDDNYNEDFYSPATPPACHSHRGCGCGLKPIAHPAVKASPNDKVAAVVVSISDGGSFDAMFTEIPQEGAPGTRVAVYQTDSANLPTILRALKGMPAHSSDTQERQDAVQKLMADINMVDNDCVVFNWECCGDCGDHGFSGDSATVIQLMRCLLDRGSMVMASDFSLKALIKDWDATALGPNPFVKIGTFGQQFKLNFQPAVLKECPSSQLQNVGSLCEDKGYAVVSAMSDTIAYTVDPTQTQHDKYKLEVLSVATEMCGFNLETGLPPAMRCEVNSAYGAAGHVLLTYPSGGTMLVSAGHWLELMQLDVSLESLRATAMKEYGDVYTSEMMDQLQDSSLSTEMRAERMQSYAKRMVLSSAPCSKRLSSKYL